FTDAGNIIGPTTFVATLEDGTPEGHTISFDITNLRMGRLTSLEGTSTDGSEGTGDIQVNAAIYASGTGSVQPLLVLEGVSAGTKSATLGGVTFTVNRATKDDVGLTAFVKAYGYAKGTLEDRALQFQIGAHEGDVTRIGIAKMDVATIFRAGENGYEYSDIELTDKLVAQDLIGQVDDALNFVSGENLRIGAFQNSMSRWLEGQRQQATSITGALSNLEDADMATEATVQSKRSILVQSGMAMLAQANTNHQYLLQLLR
ncbi:MAG: hypothetical protein FJX76_20700, partial [Armatimonadetes bacterium]|nr:hypothetical protein [Armatimonadota bacterium]